MTAFTSFKLVGHTRLFFGTLLTSAMLMQSSCTTYQSVNHRTTVNTGHEDAAVSNHHVAVATDTNTSQTTGGSSNVPKQAPQNGMSDAAAVSTTMVSQYLNDCSREFKLTNQEFIQEYSSENTTTPYSYDDKPVTEFINQSFVNESVSCELGALAYAEAISNNIISNLAMVANTVDVGATGQVKVALNLDVQKQEINLFEIYLRRGALVQNDDQSLSALTNANQLWNKWAIVPINFSNPADAKASIVSTVIMKQAINRITQFLQDSEILKKNPDRRALLIDQALIYTVQLNEQYAKELKQIGMFAASSQWRNNIINTVDGINSSEDIDDILSIIKSSINDNNYEVLSQFLDLTSIRYEDFDQNRMVESAKGFLIQNVDQLALSQLLVAMDYAQLDDKTSSQRWIDKVANNSRMLQRMCLADREDLAHNREFFESAQGQWFRAQITSLCQ